MASTDLPKSESAPVDEVRVRRARVAKWSLLANRVGYLFVALAMALFFMAFVLTFNSTMATLIIVSLVIGCVLLAPSIVIGYAVKAAERDDVEHGR
jgi:hypothetical protein